MKTAALQEILWKRPTDNSSIFWWQAFFWKHGFSAMEEVPSLLFFSFFWCSSSFSEKKKNLGCLSKLKLSCLQKANTRLKMKTSPCVFIYQLIFSRLARCPARVPAWAFCGGSPQLCGVQLRGRVALPQQRLLVPVLGTIPRMQLSLCRHQGHGGEPGEEQTGLERLQPRVHGIR